MQPRAAEQNNNREMTPTQKMLMFAMSVGIVADVLISVFNNREGDYSISLTFSEHLLADFHIFIGAMAAYMLCNLDDFRHREEGEQVRGDVAVDDAAAEGVVRRMGFRR
jgi:hypothetical protein